MRAGGINGRGGATNRGREDKSIGCDGRENTTHDHGGGAAGYLFAAAGGQQMDSGVHPGPHGHHAQFGAAAGIESGEAQEHYRSLGAGFHLLRDLAG